MSVAKFRGVYTVLLCYFAALAGVTDSERGRHWLPLISTLQTDQAIAYRIPTILMEAAGDSKAIGRRAWDEIAGIIEYDGAGIQGLFKGAFVLMGEARWRHIERRL